MVKAAISCSGMGKSRPSIVQKGQMYKQWLEKQSSGFCGMQVIVSQWDKTRECKCPDCGQHEATTHLNPCANHNQTQLLHNMEDRLGDWLDDNYTHPELAYWLPCYINLHRAQIGGFYPSLTIHATF